MEILFFLLVLVGIGLLALRTPRTSPEKVFSDSEMAAFKKAEAVRKELDEVKTIVAPAPPKPDYGVTVGLTVPKASAPEAEKK